MFTTMPEGAERVGDFSSEPLYYVPEGCSLDGVAIVPGYYFWNRSYYVWLSVADTNALKNAAVARKATLTIRGTLPHERANHVFQGQPDARQSGDQNLPTTRFRPRFRALDDAEKNLHDAIKAKADELLSLYAEIGPLRALLNRTEPNETPHVPASTSGRYVALAVTDLEKTVMWAVKALTT